MSLTKVTIIGMGYVGVPLALAFANKGFEVMGYDISEETVKRINNGTYPKTATNYKKLPLKVTSNPAECLPDSDFIIICVPTPLTEDGKPNVSYVESAANTISKHLRKGQTIISESTSHPGTTEEIIQPILEKTGLKAGADFGLAFSPERMTPEDSRYIFEEVPKLVSGINKETTDKVFDLYAKIIKRPIRVSSIKVAEAAKILENSFRYVNISFINELALIFEKMGINTYEVVDAAATKHAGFMTHYPGPGVGGHCIPVDPMFLYWKAKNLGVEMEFLKLSEKINHMMPLHVVELVEKNSESKKVLVLGISFKPNSSDTRESPSAKVLKSLKERGYTVKYFDPHVDKFENMESEKDVKKAISENDTIVLATGHEYFKNLDTKWLDDKTIVDACNFFKSKVGKKYVGLGKEQN